MGSNSNIKIEIKDLQVIISCGKSKVKKEIDIVDKRVHENYPSPLKELVALHEAGHSIVSYAMNSKHPILIKARNSDSSIGGYCKTDGELLPKKSDMVKKIALCLGGFCAEILANGVDEYTVGSGSDIQKATQIATQAVRSYAMGSHIGNSGLVQAQITISHKKKEDEIEAENLLEEGLFLAYMALSVYNKEWKLLSKALEKNVIMRTDDIARVTGLK
jgi:ATP-dependent Zn protease